MRTGLTHIVVGAGALLLGLLLGGMGPRAQVRALEAKLAESRRCDEGIADDLAAMFGGRPWSPKARRRVSTPVSAPVVAEPDEPRVPDAGSPGTPAPEDGDNTTVDREEVLALARDTLELRYTQAREALIQRADPTPEQLEAIDAAIQRMNDDLFALAETFLEEAKRDGQPSRRDTMEFAADTLDVLLKAEDALRDQLDEEQLAALDEESLDPTAYIEPAFIDLLGNADR